ncbi:MAG: MFS transporter [Saccharothrix sp.]|nr:MFS transporter [Saccharothrix sp.]
MLELLRDATYLRYYIACVVSFLGDAMTRIVLIYVAATLTQDPVVIALVVIAQLLPIGVLGTFLGPLIDRLPKRTLLVGSDLARLVIVLAVIPALGSVWLMLALVVLQGVGKAVFETARIAAIHKFVGGHSLPTAVALFQSTAHILNLAGPALGGVLVALGSVPVVLVLDAGTFVVSALLLGSLAVLKEPPVRAADGERYWQALRTGIRSVLAIPSLRFLSVFMVPVMLVFGLFTTNLNAQLLTVFELPADQYGFAQAVFAGGSVVGAAVGPGMLRRFSSGSVALVATVALFGATLVLVAPTEWAHAELGLVAVAAWCALTGLGAGLFQVPAANTMLRDLPEGLRGRGVGLLNAIMTNFMVIGVALGGVTASLWGVAVSIVVAGVFLVLAAAAFAASARASRLSEVER